MAALAAAPSTLAKLSDGDGNRSALTTREVKSLLLWVLIVPMVSVSPLDLYLQG